jgi:hypothetical protein
MKTVVILLALLVSISANSQIVISKEVVIGKGDKEKLKATSTEFKRAVSDAMKKHYPVSLDFCKIETRCENGKFTVLYEATMYECDQLDADFHLDGGEVVVAFARTTRGSDRKVAKMVERVASKRRPRVNKMYGEERVRALTPSDRCKKGLSISVMEPFFVVRRFENSLAP